MKYKLCHVKFIAEWVLLSHSLSLLEYNDSLMRGLKLINVSNKFIDGIYYEKIAYSEIVHHPINGVTTEIKETFLHTNFSICREISTIVLSDPGRRANSFFSFVSIKNSNLFMIRDISYNIKSFCEVAKEKFSTFRLKRITFPPMNFSSQSIAAITISSQNDALEESIFLGIALPIEFLRIEFECGYNSKRITGSVSRSGIISLSSNADRNFLDCILSIL